MTQDPFDRRALDYHCFICGAIFKLNPDRAYLVSPFLCEPCEDKAIAGIAKAFDETELFNP